MSTFASFALMLTPMITLFEKKPTSVSALRLRKLTRLPVAHVKNRSLLKPVREMIAKVSAWARSRMGLFAGEALRTQLAEAGFPDSFAADVYAVTCLAALPFGFACGVLLPQGRLLGMVAAVAVFSLLPSAAAKAKASKD